MQWARAREQSSARPPSVSRDVPRRSARRATPIYSMRAPCAVMGTGGWRACTPQAVTPRSHPGRLAVRGQQHEGTVAVGDALRLGEHVAYVVPRVAVEALLETLLIEVVPDEACPQIIQVFSEQ